MGKYLKWTEEEFSYLKENYSKLKREEISKFLNRKWDTIAKKASILGLYRACSNSHFYKLLEESNVAYYWMGFLFADGHFSKDNEFSINLQESDIDHLTKFSNYVSVPVRHLNNRPYISVRIMDKIIVKQIKDKFKIHNNKTENAIPVEVFKNMTDDHFLSMFVGFIDGDGNIKHQTGRTDCCLQLAFHKSWKTNFEYFLERLSGLSNIKLGNQIKFNVQNTLRTNISNYSLIKFLKKHLLKVDIPAMHRKWDKVMENELNYDQQVVVKVERIKNLILSGFSKKEIAVKENLTIKQLSDFVQVYKISHKRLGINIYGKKVGRFINDKLVKSYLSITQAANDERCCVNTIANHIEYPHRSKNGYIYKYLS